MKFLPIAVAERESGISKDSLRVWEKRYGFPTPERDENGDRSYPLHQVEKLKLIKQLIERGNRPAKLVSMSLTDLQDLLTGHADDSEASEEQVSTQVLELLRATDHTELIAVLTQKLASLGLVSFVIEELGPLNVAVGQAWAQGKISVAQEHLYTEVVQKLLRAYILNLGLTRGSPRVLLATLPGEQHGLGLLMVESVMAASGAMPISLGTEVPVSDIAAAAVANRCDVVAISFSRARTPAFVSQGVKALREQIEQGRQLWIGGQGANWMRQAMEGVTHLSDLRSLRDRLTNGAAQAG